MRRQGPGSLTRWSGLAGTTLLWGLLTGLAAGCGTSPDQPGLDAGPGDAARDDGPGCADAATPQVAVETVLELQDMVHKLLALDDGALGIITLVPAHTNTFCPDCEAMDIPDAECPAACSRKRLEWSVLDSTGTLVLGPITVRTFALPTSGSYLEFTQAARLSTGDVGMAWALCTSPPARSCDVEYAVFTATGEPVGPRIDLYHRLYGQITLAVNQSAGTVLVARSSDLHTRTGLWVALLGEDGTILRDFVRAGSSYARAPAITVLDDGFAVVAEDRDPFADDSRCPACATLLECAMQHPDCSFGGAIAPEAGLWAYPIGGTDTGVPEQVATGWGEDGLYCTHQTYAAGRAGPGIAAVSWWWNYHQDDTPDYRLVTARRSPDGVWTSVAQPADYGVIRWLGVVPDAGDRVRFLAEGTAASSSDGLMPRAFVAGEGSASLGRVGDPFRGWTFGPTGHFAANPAYLAGGILNADGSDYDHWSLFRLSFTP